MDFVVNMKIGQVFGHTCIQVTTANLANRQLQRHLHKKLTNYKKYSK